MGRALAGHVYGIAVVLAVAATGNPTSAANATSESTVDYVTEVRPILSAKCFFCHGPDEATREAGLRLDEAEAAYADLGGYAAIAPHSPDDSEVVLRIDSTEDGFQMPPADSGKSLTAEEIETLRRWIAEGAEYRPHWAFQRLKRPQVPAEPQGSTPIDKFVRRKLNAESLKPAAPADSYTLARRVHLDLIGLPPEPEVAARFAADPSPEAYRNMVDDLLGEPAYGERWARHWLDLARYSDTKGFEKDQPRIMWPYRDWVIDALNADMPFDQFSIEQLAGDMLPNPTTEQLVATGFHRNTMTNEEGGIDPEEFRFVSIVDRVNTTGATWLGLTVGCAQCHTHKYDPITHTDYFSLFALLNNADEIETPLHDPDIARRQAAVDSEIAELRGSLPYEYEKRAKEKQLPLLDEAVTSWAEQLQSKVVRWRPQRPVRIETNLPLTEVLPDSSVLVSGDVTNADCYKVWLDPRERTVSAVRIEAIPDESLPRGGSGRRTIGEQRNQGIGGFLLTEVKVGIDDSPVEVESASATYVMPELSAELAIDGRPDTGWAMLRRQRERQSLVLQLKESVTLAEGERLLVTLEHESFYPAGIGRFRISTTNSNKKAEADGLSEQAVEAVLAKAEERDSAQRACLEEAFLNNTETLSDLNDQLHELISQRPTRLTALTLRERMSSTRATHRRHRGEYLKPREVVEPNTLSALPPLPEDAPANRLAMARWLVSRDNPLTARVVVNRHWQAFFGTGLVKTTADFGLQGEYPSHPELLDWLASEFMDNGWSLKQLHRTIVLSDTYKQSSTNHESYDKDPENRLLARVSRVRLPSETIRDVVLKTSGLLSGEIGGPSVFPPQPPGITEAAYGALQWVVSEGEDRYRRGLYTFNKRTAPYAAFGLFDAPSGEVCVPRRDRSTTPLQALAMLNDVVIGEAARALALSLPLDQDHKAAQRLLTRTLTRPADDDSIQSVVEFVTEQRDRLRSGELEAARVLNSAPEQRWKFDVGQAGWEPRSDVELAIADGALVATAVGPDPYIGRSVAGPAGEYTLTLAAQHHGEGPVEIFWTTEDAPNESPERRAVVMSDDDSPSSLRATFSTKSPLRTLRIDTGTVGSVTTIESVNLRYGDGLIDIQSVKDPENLAAWAMAARAVLNLDEVITRP